VRGHIVRVLVQEADDKVPGLFRPHPQLSFASLAIGRGDDWREAAPLLRTGRDYLQYLGEAYAAARKLRLRAFERLLYQLDIERNAVPAGASEAARLLPSDAIERLRELAAVSERAIPSDPFHERALQAFEPDAVLVSPLVHFGSAQADFVKAAQALGVPVGMLLFSWDNLSTKGALHVAPDRLFVWNEQQRQEAFDLHGLSPERIAVTGAPRFDRFFELRPLLARASFCAPFGLDPAKPILLYLCSSRLVSEREPAFIREWHDRIRASRHDGLRGATLIVRPHPDLPVEDRRWLGPEQTGRWDGLDILFRARRMFDDPATLLLSSESGQASILHECLHHARAAVGLNTSAEIEAAIAGRPVFTVLVDETRADGQQSTLHFKYLLDENGGWVTVSPTLDDHEVRLASMLDAAPRTGEVQEAVRRFVRPLGWATPASHVMVEAIEQQLRGSGVPSDAGAVSARATPMVAPAPTRRLPSGEEARVIAVEHGAAAVGTTLWVAVSNDAEAEQARIASRSPWIVEQLASVAVAGRPFYVIGADGGAVALIAARGLGATVFAFEPDIPSMARLWDNVLINECEGNLVPLALSIGAKRVLEEQRTASAAPGAARAVSRRRVWREHPGSPRMVLQPRLSLPLDTAIKIWGLPAPHAIYLGPLAAVASIVRGARLTLEAGAIVLMETSAESAPAATQALAAAGLTVTARARQPNPATAEALLFSR
jgi:hypothetical protein